MRCRTLVRTSLSLRLISLWLNRHQIQGDSHPVRGNNLPPLASLLAPENCRYHAASNGSGFTDPVVLPLGSPTPLWLTAWAYQRITTPASCLSGTGQRLIRLCGCEPTPI